MGSGLPGTHGRLPPNGPKARSSPRPPAGMIAGRDLILKALVPGGIILP